VKGGVKQLFDAAGLTEEIGEHHFHPSVRAAVTAAAASEGESVPTP
jgi:hypothetical protein